MKNSRIKAATAAQHFDSLPDSARIKSTVALVILGVDSLSTLWRWEKSGRMPPSQKIGGSRYKSWAAEEIRRVRDARGG
ncbi:MAG: transcriptional regulator [Gammaproteobacteria bacterium]|nr:transcriptional regulator [Gammaproteobacteria bacterium]MBU1602521.1 transcriptional regulator [Gammaproteobacteria bacterium]MBU2433326.1 transcriptional regulator [Gammaproteobacteria bacterium]MBU2451242.1 transcriptional regulator [Gammaproteobacteria bacterium]